MCCVGARFLCVPVCVPRVRATRTWSSCQVLPVALLVLLRAAGRAPTPVQLGHRALSAPANVTLSPKGSRRRVRGVSEETKDKEEVRGLSNCCPRCHCCPRVQLLS